MAGRLRRGPLRVPHPVPLPIPTNLDRAGKIVVVRGRGGEGEDRRVVARGRRPRGGDCRRRGRRRGRGGGTGRVPPRRRTAPPTNAGPTGPTPNPPEGS